MPKRKSTQRRGARSGRRKKVVESFVDSSGFSDAESFDCDICMDTKPVDDISNTTTCFHPYCNNCIAQHIKAKVQDNVANIKCPDQECEEPINFQNCIGVIPKSVLDSWENVLSRSMISSTVNMYCPFRDCSAGLLIENDSNKKKKGRKASESEPKVECPHCKRELCIKCKVPWHNTMSCEGFAKLGEDEKQAEEVMLRNLANDEKWVRCPKCKFYVQRTVGCNQMSCRCGCYFCYGCGQSRCGGWCRR